MEVNIYKVTNKSSGYIFIPKDKLPKEVNIPNELKFDENYPWKSMDIKENDNRIALDIEEVISQISAQGYAYTEATIKIEIEENLTSK
jgi:uncharacterized protein YcgL (UPF0745 family)